MALIKVAKILQQGNKKNDATSDVIVGTWDATANLTTSTKAMYNGITLQNPPQSIFKGGEIFIVTNAGTYGTHFGNYTYHNGDKIWCVKKPDGTLTWEFIPGPEALPYPFTVSVSSAGQNTFALPAIPTKANLTELYINHDRQLYGIDFNVSSNNINYIGGMNLVDTDNITGVMYV